LVFGWINVVKMSKSPSTFGIRSDLKVTHIELQGDATFNVENWNSGDGVIKVYDQMQDFGE